MTITIPRCTAGVAMSILSKYVKRGAALAMVGLITQPAWHGLEEPGIGREDGNEPASSYIVQAESSHAAAELVQSVGGETKRRLGIVKGVQAELTNLQIDALTASDASVRVTEDLPVVKLAARKLKNSSLSTSDTATIDDASFGTVDSSSTDSALSGDTLIRPLDYAHAPSLIDANRLHNQGIDGRGVTIAVVDTGIWETYGSDGIGTAGTPRAWRVTTPHGRRSNPQRAKIGDEHGHGTHVLSVMASSDQNAHGPVRRRGAHGPASLRSKAFDADRPGQHTAT